MTRRHSRWPLMTFKLTHLSYAFSTVIFRTFVQQSATFQLTWNVARSLCDSWAACVVVLGYCNEAVASRWWKAWWTRIWANAQRDGRPAEYRWRPLFNTAKFGWCPLLECHAVTLSRCETRWNLQGCPKLSNRSQPLVGRSSLYYEDMWRRYCCLRTFFPIVNNCLSCEDIAR